MFLHENELFVLTRSVISTYKNFDAEMRKLPDNPFYLEIGKHFGYLRSACKIVLIKAFVID